MDLKQLKSELSTKLLLSSRPIHQQTMDEILDHQFSDELIECVLLKIEEDDAGPNVVKILDYAFKRKALLEHLYPKLSSSKSRYILIDYITEKFKDKELDMAREDVNFLIELFRKCLNKPFEDSSEVDKVELVKMSDLVGLLSSTSNCDYDKSLINKDLIKLIIETLGDCHRIGKEANKAGDQTNPLRIISKLSQVNDTSSLDKEIFFGFKSNLIKILGNFAHSNKEVQDWIRELDGISLILDCTNIDARNPFIIQWSVLAIRNILKNNVENQEFVRNVSKKSSLKIDLSKIM